MNFVAMQVRLVPGRAARQVPRLQNFGTRYTVGVDLSTTFIVELSLPIIQMSFSSKSTLL